MRCPNCQFDGDPDDYAICTECGQPRFATSGPASPEYGAPPAALPRGPSLMPPAGGPAMPVAGLQGPHGAETRPARLMGLEGPVDGQEFPLLRPEVEIGRRNECDIVVSDPSVSRRHARLRLVSGGCVIEDLESANGTWVNGVRLSGPQPLFERDVIRVGKAAFTFRAEVQAPQVPPGSQTMVSDLGAEPNPFGEQSGGLGGGPPLELPSAAAPPRTPAPDPVVARRLEVAPSVAAPPAGPVAPPGPAPSEVPSGVSAELAALRRELTAALARVETLGASMPEPGASGGGARSDLATILHQLNEDLEVQGGEERYRDLRRLLESLRSDPHDLKLLLQLADELPAIDRLVQVYLRALSSLRSLGQQR